MAYSKEMIHLVSDARITNLFISLLMFPVCFVLFVIRVPIYFHCYLLSIVLYKYPNFKQHCLKLMLISLGLFVSEAKQSKKSSAKISPETPIVSNFGSLFDSIVMNCVFPSFSTTRSAFSWAFSYIDVRAHREGPQLGRLLQFTKQPLHLLPEARPNGYANFLIKFDALQLAHIRRVQLVGITSYRAFPVNYVAYPLSTFWELFWQLAVPITSYKVKLGAVLERRCCESNDREGEGEESDEEFADRVRKGLAELLSGDTLSSSKQKLLSEDHFAIDKLTNLISGGLDDVIAGTSDRATDSSSRRGSGNSREGSAANRKCHVNPARQQLTDEQCGEGETAKVDDCAAAVSQEDSHLTGQSRAINPCRFSVPYKSDDRVFSLSQRKEMFLENARQYYLERNQQTKKQNVEANSKKTD